MKGIECAFVGVVDRVDLRTAKTGRQWLSMGVTTGEEPEQQWVNVAAFFGHIEELVATPKGTRVYVEGKIKLRTWEDDTGNSRASLSVSASLIQPLAQIGEKRPKRPRTPRQPATAKPPADHQRPIEFNDELPI